MEQVTENDYFSLYLLPYTIWFIEILSYFPRQEEILRLRLVNKWFRRLIAAYENWSPIFPLLLQSNEPLNSDLWNPEFPWLDPNILFVGLRDFNVWADNVDTTDRYIPLSDYALRARILIVGDSKKCSPENDYLELLALKNLIHLIRRNKSKNPRLFFPPNLEKIVFRFRYIANGGKNRQDMDAYLIRLFHVFSTILPEIELWFDIPKDTSAYLIQKPFHVTNDYEIGTEHASYNWRIFNEFEEMEVDHVYQPLFNRTFDTPSIAGVFLSDNACGILTAYSIWYEKEYIQDWRTWTDDMAGENPLSFVFEIVTHPQHVMHKRAMEEVQLAGKKLLFKMADDARDARILSNTYGVKIVKWLIEQVGIAVEMDFHGILVRQNTFPYQGEVEFDAPVISPPTLIHVFYKIEEYFLEDSSPQQAQELIEVIDLLTSLGADPNREDCSWVDTEEKFSVADLKPKLESKL